jgi:hypothetical protein
MPRRVASPPVVPVAIYRLSMARQALSGKLVLSGCNDEVLTLDGGLSGPVLFNAETGKVEVGSTDAAAAIQDNFACADSTLSGLLLMGKDPGCREPGENPDREIVAVRMTNADTADLIGAVPQCATSPGRAPEITPVKVVPIELDVVSHQGTVINPRTLAFSEEQAVDCNGIRRTLRKWFSFRHWHQPEVEGTESGDSADPGESQNLWFTAWKKVTEGGVTTKKLVQLTKEGMLALLSSEGTVGPPSQVFTRPRPTLVSKFHNTGDPITPLNVSVNLTGLPEYSSQFVGVMLTVDMGSYTGTRNFDIIFTVDNEIFARVKHGVDNQGSTCTNSFIVPIPASKQLVLKTVEETNSLGTYGDFGLIVYLDGFVR